MRSIVRDAVIVLALITAACWAARPGTNKPVIPTAAATKVFAEAHQLCTAEGGRLWGKSLCGPMLLVDPSTRQAVLNGPALGAVEDDSVFRLVLPAELGVANTAVRLDGKRWSMLLWPLPKDATKRHILLMHEAFHRIQPALHLPEGGGLVSNAHLDTRNGRVWLRGELQALAAALGASGEARRRDLTDALVMRSYRRSLWPGADMEERSLELNEGLAEWTGIAAALTEPQQRVRAALDDIATCEEAASFVRSFAYATGPAYAQLLDEVQPGWRARVNGDFDLGDAVAAAYDLKLPAPSAEAAAAALARHDGARIEAEEDARQRKVAARNERYAALFITGPTVTFPIESMQISFDPRAVEAFEDHGNVYRTLQIHDAWGTLKVNAGAALIPPAFNEVVVPVAAQTASGHLAGDGWSATLAHGYALVPNPERTGSYRVESGRP